MITKRGPYLATWYNGAELVTLNTGTSVTRKTIKVFRTREAAQAALDSWLAPLKRESVHTPRVMSLAQFRVEATDYSEYVPVWAH